MAKVVTSPYKPREIQAKLHKAATRFCVLVCHRRFGKTVFAINHIIQKLLTNKLNRPQYAYIAPEKSQAKKVAWEYLKEYTSFLPGVQYFESELKCEIQLTNKTKGVIYLEGAENPDRLRGMYFDGVILDEVAQMPKSIWTEIVRPALSDRGGWSLFIGTPKGKNYFKELYEYASNADMIADGWSSFMYKASESNVIADGELKSLQRQMSEEEYEQEYECNFEAAIPGSYYGTMLTALRKEGHINATIGWSNKHAVVTAWDIGMNDKTCIWFAQKIGNEVFVIDYYEASGQILSHYINVVKAKPYVYDYHILPHDANVRNISTGGTRLTELESMGLRCYVAKRIPVIDGINSVRSLLPICRFSASKCEKGLSALAYYHSVYNDRNDVQQLIPVHDWSSHAADAFRYLAVGMKADRRFSDPLNADPFGTKSQSSYDHDPF
jgi:hypothetical protein